MSSVPLTLDGSLTLQGPGIRLYVEGRTNALAVHAADRRALWRLWRSAPGARHIEDLASGLRHSGLAVDIFLRGVAVARAGGEGRDSWVLRRLGMPGLRVAFVPLMAAFLGYSRRSRIPGPAREAS